MATFQEIRTRRDLTVRELAAQAEVAPSTIYRIENSRATPRLKMVQRLAATLAIEPREIEEFRRAIAQAAVGWRSRGG